MPDEKTTPTPMRRAYSREEMIAEAKQYMREAWGPCRESADRDRWCERLGMLIDFVTDRFPANAASGGEYRGPTAEAMANAASGVVRNGGE